MCNTFIQSLLSLTVQGCGSTASCRRIYGVRAGPRQESLQGKVHPGLWGGHGLSLCSTCLTKVACKLEATEISQLIPAGVSTSVILTISLKNTTRSEQSSSLVLQGTSYALIPSGPSPKSCTDNEQEKSFANRGSQTESRSPEGIKCLTDGYSSHWQDQDVSVDTDSRNHASPPAPPFATAGEIKPSRTVCRKTLQFFQARDITQRKSILTEGKANLYLPWPFLDSFQVLAV